jgi:hypothetical protein
LPWATRPEPRTLQREIDQLLRQVPGLGMLVGLASELRDRAKATRAKANHWEEAASRSTDSLSKTDARAGTALRAV